MLEVKFALITILLKVYSSVNINNCKNFNERALQITSTSAISLTQVVYINSNFANGKGSLFFENFYDMNEFHIEIEILYENQNYTSYYKTNMDMCKFLRSVSDRDPFLSLWYQNIVGSSERINLSKLCPILKV